MKYFQEKNKLVSSKRIIGLIVLWQSISVLLMALGVWPEWMAWVNTGLVAVFVIFAKPYDSVLLLVLSIPFYVVLPNRYLPTIPGWRVLFALLFIVWLSRFLFAQQDYVRKTLSFRRWYREMSVTNTPWFLVIWNAMKRVNSRLMPWDKIAALFVVVVLLSLTVAQFPKHGFKQLLYLVNIYLLYIVIINVVTDQDKVKELIKYVAGSLAIIVGIGYVQFIATLFASPYYFWQYWATMVSRIYYGQPLSDVLIYSNSWFSYSGNTQSLRMFSIMPDSHSFALIAAFFITYLVALLLSVPRRSLRSAGDYFLNIRTYFWSAIRLSGFAVVLSGTRGVWVGMLAPLLLAIYLYIRDRLRPFLKLMFVSYGLIILLFALSPFINQGLAWLRVSGFRENFLDRAQSIYDLQEHSNAGRLEIWEDSAKFAVMHPFGVGYGNFIVSLIDDIPDGTPFESVGAERNLRYNLPQKFVTAHSLFLHILVELGFAGLLVFLLFWWEYVSSVIRFFKEYRYQFNIYTMFIVSVMLMIVWILAHGVFDVTLFNDRVLMYTLLSLAISGLIMTKYHSFTDTE